MNEALQEVLDDPRVWRAGRRDLRWPTLSSGYPQLDAWLPDGGWPAGRLTEMAVERWGSGELALFSLQEHGQNVLMYKSNGEDAIQTSHEIGLREPLHCSGLGKAILSELPRERVEAIVDERGLPQFTENTITSRDRLFDELERTRERGYAIDDEEAKPGIRCVAAPVVFGEGNLYGAVSVTAPRSRMKGERLDEALPELVTGVANVIEVNAIYA